MSDIYTEYTRIKHELAAAQAENAKLREDMKRGDATLCRMEQEHDTLTAAVNALLDEIDEHANYRGSMSDAVVQAAAAVRAAMSGAK